MSGHIITRWRFLFWVFASIVSIGLVSSIAQCANGEISDKPTFVNTQVDMTP